MFSYHDVLTGMAALWTTLNETPTNRDPQKQCITRQILESDTLKNELENVEDTVSVHKLHL